MNIICIGVDYRSADVAQREKVGLKAAQLKSLANETLELAVISTCNRVELYAAGDAAASHLPTLLDQWSTVTDVTVAELNTITTQYDGQAAVDHLLRVSAGLDSLVLGEPQILGQVNEAFEQAQAHQLCGPTMRTLFRTAVRTGKRVRTETKIGRNAASISSVAVNLAAHHLGDLKDKKVVLIGAGKMGVLALKALAAQQVGEIAVVNRTRQHAQAVAKQFDGTAYGFEHLQQLMIESDLVISSTGAPYTLIDSDFMRPVSAARTTPLLMMDIAVPRDVAPDVRDLPHIDLFDIDALQGVVDEAVHQRKQEIPHVEAIILEEATILERKLQQLEARPTITALRAQAEQIRQRELNRMLKSMPNADNDTIAQFELLSQSLVNKLLHAPTARLREVAADGDSSNYTNTVRELFALDTTT